MCVSLWGWGSEKPLCECPFSFFLCCNGGWRRGPSFQMAAQDWSSLDHWVISSTELPGLQKILPEEDINFYCVKPLRCGDCLLLQHMPILSWLMHWSVSFNYAFSKVVTLLSPCVSEDFINSFSLLIDNLAGFRSSVYNYFSCCILSFGRYYCWCNNAMSLIYLFSMMVLTFYLYPWCSIIALWCF